MDLNNYSDDDHERDDSNEFNPMTDHRDLAGATFTLTIDDDQGEEHEITLEYNNTTTRRTSFSVGGGGDIHSPLFWLDKNHSFWMEIFNSNGGEKRYTLTVGERRRLMDLYVRRSVGSDLHFTPARRGPVLIKADYGY